MNDMRDLYEELILDHNRNPRNYPKKPADANRSVHGFNPLCGDELFLHLTVQDSVIKDVGFEGSGCAISTASTSLMTEAIIGKTVAEAETLFNRVHGLLTDTEMTDDSPDALGKLIVLKGVKEYPMRIKCATLSWHTLQAALKQSGESVTTE